MADTPKCPTCHSKISSDPTQRERGSAGMDNEGNPIPRWTDDPVLTSNGLSGNSYKGLDRPRKIHIEELQADRRQLEAELDIYPPTEFSDIAEHGFHVRKTHLIELRESTEKILDAVNSNLTEYFALDADGKPVSPGPNDQVKTDWTDVQRGLTYLDKDANEKKTFELPVNGSMLCPTFPTNTRIRAIHIEDLRHFIKPNLWAALFLGSGIGYGDFAPAGISKRETLATDSQAAKQYFTDWEYINAISIPGGGSMGSLLNGNNLTNSYIVQRRIVHQFSASSAGMYYSSLPALTAATDVHSWALATFDPELPFSSETVEEGLLCVAIDPSGDDYILYTVEFFYERAGKSPLAWQDGDGGNPFIEEGHTGSYIARYTFPRKRILGTSNGEPGQNFYAKSAGIICPVPDKGVALTVNNVEWQLVTNFNSSTMSSLHYTLDKTSGLITFGNGKKGKIPTKDATICMEAFLTDGGVWKFKDIIVPWKEGTIYFGVQALNGKLWYQQIDNAFTAAYACSPNTETEMPVKHREFHGYEGGPLCYETWYSDTTNRRTVTGQAAFLRQLDMSGTVDSTIGFFNGYTDHQLVTTDDADNFRYTDYCSRDAGDLRVTYIITNKKHPPTYNKGCSFLEYAESVTYKSVYTYFEWDPDLNTSVLKHFVYSTPQSHIDLRINGAPDDMSMMQIADQEEGEDVWRVWTPYIASEHAPLDHGQKTPVGKWYYIPAAGGMSHYIHRTTNAHQETVDMPNDTQQTVDYGGDYVEFCEYFYIQNSDSATRPAVPLTCVFSSATDFGRREANETGLIAAGGTPWAAYTATANLTIQVTDV